MPKLKGNWDTLGGVLVQIEKMLTRGASHFNDSFHWPVLGTTGENGCSQRSVILRGYQQKERLLVCHTDSRATKAQEIELDSRVSWLFYHPKKKIQLRITGKAALHTDDQFADAQWTAASKMNRLNYSTSEAPGTVISKPSTGLPELVLNKLPTLLESESARGNFMSISCRFDSIDWLLLSPLGNRRAFFQWTGEEMSASWIIP
jgi:pyridoxamine 5'-phosphate oxidase